MHGVQMPWRRAMAGLAIGALGALLPSQGVQAQTAGGLDVVVAAASYQGSANNKAACSRTYRLSGWAPKAATGRPLFIYLPGADSDPLENETRAPQAVAKAMAQRGFVSFAAQYDSSLTAFFSNRQNVMQCLFDVAAPHGMLNTLCQDARVDCNKGIVLWGHSFGGMLSLAAYNREPRVRAVWATGVSTLKDPYGVATRLPRQRIRLVNGVKDSVPLIGGILVGNNNSTSRLNNALGLTPSLDCAGQSNQCLRPDGSGWILVQTADMSPAYAPAQPDHCWFESKGCNSSGYYAYDDYFFDALDERGAYRSRIAIGRQADWLAQVAQTAP
jgi:hypothetical protein